MNGRDVPTDDTDPVWDRSTAPQSPYGGREIGIGIVVLLAGLLIVFGLPAALA